MVLRFLKEEKTYRSLNSVQKGFGKTTCFTGKEPTLTPMETGNELREGVSVSGKKYPKKKSNGDMLQVRQ